MEDRQSIIGFLSRERETSMKHCPVDGAGAMILNLELPTAKAAYLRAHYLQAELAALQGAGSEEQNSSALEDAGHWGAVCSDLVGLFDAINSNTYVHSHTATDNSKALYSPEALERMETNYKQRIKNLEKFRKLFFNLSDQLNEFKNASKGDLKTSSVAEELADISVEPVNREAVDAPMRELKSNQQAQADLVASLQEKVTQLQAVESQNEDQIAENLEMLQKLEQQLKESKGCTSMLEEEVDRLMDQADEIKAENQQLKAKMILQEAESNNKEKATEQDKAIESTKSEPLVLAEAKITALDAELTQTSEMAFGFMKNCSDIGSVVQFMIESLESRTEQSLAKALFEAVNTMGLSAALLITQGGKYSFYASRKDLKISKKSKVWATKSKSRLVHVEGGLLLLGRNARMYVDTDSVDDAATIDRLKDNVQKLSLGLDAAASKLLDDVNRLESHKRLETIIQMTDGACHTFGEAIQLHVGEMRDLLSGFISESKQRLELIEMIDTDKNHLLKFITESSNKILGKTSDTLSLDQEFRLLRQHFKDQ